MLHAAWTSNRPTLVLLRVGLNVLGAAWLLYSLLTQRAPSGFDSYAYWSIDLSRLYSMSSDSMEAGAYRYSPLFAQLLDPAGSLPWGIFSVGFLTLSLLALVILGGRWALALLLVPNVLGEIYFGNIDLFVAVALGFGLVWPAAWSLLVISKATPAVVIVWFVARREWRNLALVIAGVLGLAFVSLLTTPGLWVDWFWASTRFASSPYGLSEIPTIPRLVAAAGLVLIGAHRNWRWTIAVGGTLAMPGLEWKTMTALLAILPLYGLGLMADVGPCAKSRVKLRSALPEGR